MRDRGPRRRRVATDSLAVIGSYPDEVRVSALEPEGPENEDLALVVLTGPAAGRRITFADELRLGRAELDGGDLGGDPALSRHHAVVRPALGGRATIEDLGSANGTFVNGDRIIGVRQVQVGDTVDVGDSSLRLMGDSREATAARPNRNLRTELPSTAERLPEGDTETGWAPVMSSVPERASERVAPAGPREKRGAWLGTAASVNRRADQGGKGKNSATTQVITFRLEQFTEHGDRRRVLSVELRGEELTGDVANGDRVEAHGRVRDGVLKAKAVYNLTTGATVHPVGRGVWRRLLMGGQIALKLAFVVVWICVLALIVYLALSHHVL